MATATKKGIIERPRTTCAQGGALATIGSLPDVVAISHAAEGCGGNLAGSISFNSGNNGEGYCSGNQIPTSAIREKNVILSQRRARPEGTLLPTRWAWKKEGSGEVFLSTFFTTPPHSAKNNPSENAVSND